MPSYLSGVAPPDPLFRIGRKPDPWEWPSWASVHDDGTFGNRWDDPEATYRVLYACSQRLGTFVEVLARFRPDKALAKELAEITGEDDGLQPGELPISWLQRRLVGSAKVSGTFADVGHSESLAYLRHVFHKRLVHYKLDELDASTIRLSAPRRFTQEISRHVYELAKPGTSQPAFSGIAYRSKLGDDFQNWAIFEPGHPDGMKGLLEPILHSPISPEDEDLKSAIELLGLRLVDSQ
jgi:hypothetical protein